LFADGSREEHYGRGFKTNESPRPVKRRWELDGRVKTAFGDGTKSIQLKSGEIITVPADGRVSAMTIL
jgi:hypothetical protein